jgi:hypothetical protein
VRKKSPIGLISAASWDGTGFLEDKAQVLSHPGVCVLSLTYMVYMVDLSFSTAFLRTAWDRVYFSIEEITLIYSTHTRYIYSLIMLYIQCMHIYA